MGEMHSYTIGWVAALPSERAAATALLDDRHEPPPDFEQHLSDTNSYTWGRMGKHNIVIASLPAGIYGTTAAATTVGNLLASMPQIRVGLLVGIGGGIARHLDQDVRLGDVVVSQPTGITGGVIQYDLGKARLDCKWEPKGMLNKPPQVLLNALAALQAEHEMAPSKIPDFLQAMWAKAPLMKKPKKKEPGYVHQGLENDRLFSHAYAHVDGRACDGCDSSEEILRDIRDSTDPDIHYGIIASGNTLVKDAATRDEIAELAGSDCLCVEMEAAGLMDQFPCLVVRGICDYADSHKNDRWHRYASATAAAYAKELLEYVPLQLLEQTQRAVDVLKSIGQDVRGIQASADRLIQYRHSDEENAILEWLTPVNYGLQHSNHSKKRQRGTGQWLLDSNEFQEWVVNDRQTLFCPGIPGAGKTILTSIVVDNLLERFQSDDNIGISYLYCDFRRTGEQNADDLLASLLKQLCQSKSSLPESVQDLYDRHKIERTWPSCDEISKTLLLVAKSYTRVFVIVDALDECQASDGCRQAFLSELFNLQQVCAANIFATSRFVPEITSKFSTSMFLEIQARKEDVQRYLEAHISELPSVVQKNQELREDIVTEISEAVDGMFLLAQIYLRSLNKPTVKAIKAALKGLQKQRPGSSEDEKMQTLVTAYDETMHRISGQERDWKDLAMQVLSWVTSAERPLTALELQHALSVELFKSALDQENLPQIDDMVSVCAGLVTVDSETGVIQVVHYTTQEYFDQRKGKANDWFPNAHTNMTKICITYLSFDEFKNGPCHADDTYELRLRHNPLYHYAAQNWGHHARQASHVCQLVMELLEQQATTAASIQALMVRKRHERSSNYSQKFSKQLTALHVAAYFGINEVVQRLVWKNVDVDAQDNEGRTPLLFAANNGHAAIVDLLLDAGQASADAEDYFGFTPLLVAAKNGHSATVKLLLDTGKVDVEARDEHNTTPLLRAAESGHDAVVTLLLDIGKADVESENSHYQTPLSLAAQNGHGAIVKLLLDTGKVNVASRNAFDRTPLSLAAGNGHSTVVKQLLNTGKADVECKDNNRLWSALSWAAAEGHDAVISMLLDIGKADIEMRDEFGETPLALAAKAGHVAAVRVLLNTGKVNVESKDDHHHRTPLSRAAEHGDVAVIKLLLTLGKADVEAKCLEGRTPLLWAAAYGNDTVVKLLLGMGQANVGAKDNYKQTPLSWAARGGFDLIVKSLLDAGKVEIDSKNYKGRTPLSQAVIYRRDTVAKLLIDTRMVDLESRDADGGTPLLLAAKYGSDGVVKLLLQTGRVNVESEDPEGRTPLSWAAEKGRKMAVQTLLDIGKANAESTDRYGWSPLSFAVKKEHHRIATMLRDAAKAHVGPR